MPGCCPSERSGRNPGCCPSEPPGRNPCCCGGMATIRIGVSGWRYAPWRGVFYPRELPHRAELAYASREFSTIELNGSFYSLQRPESYARWYRETPEGFVFAVKGPRYITHMLRLRGIEEPLANFFASGVLALGEKLGPLLWQFSPHFKHDLERIASFLRFLPRDTEAALALARRRSAWMKGRERLAIDAPRPLRHAVEIRHESFLDLPQRLLGAGARALGSAHSRLAYGREAQGTGDAQSLMRKLGLAPARRPAGRTPRTPPAPAARGARPELHAGRRQTPVVRV